MKPVDNERTVSVATSLQRNVGGLLQAHCTCPVSWILYQLEGYKGVMIDHRHKIVSVPATSASKEVFNYTTQIRQHGWHTQIGVIK
jgi:hypothetical protein